jgi:hypothetical protein
MAADDYPCPMRVLAAQLRECSRSAQAVVDAPHGE